MTVSTARDAFPDGEVGIDVAMRFGEPLPALVADCARADRNAHPDGGVAVALFPDWPGERFPLYALHPSRHLPSAKVRAFIDFVLEMVR